MVMLMVVVSFVAFLIIRRRFKELRGSFILIAFVLSFIVIPVYAGSAPWHVTLPAFGYLVLYGKGVAVFSSAAKPYRLRNVLRIAFVVVPVGLAVLNLQREMNAPIDSRII